MRIKTKISTEKIPPGKIWVQKTRYGFNIRVGKMIWDTADSEIDAGEKFEDLVRARKEQDEA